VLRVTVATDGKVREITTVSGDTRLVPAAREGVSKRKYQAFTHDGRPIEAQITTIVYFVPTAAGDQAFAIDDLDNEDAYVNVFRVGPGISAPSPILATPKTLARPNIRARALSVLSWERTEILTRSALFARLEWV
jgi:hypothetical protein